MTTKVFGTSVKRREDPRMITGYGNYVDDVKLTRMAHVSMARSPHAHAKIKGIDTSKAEASEGVLAVFTGAQLQDQLGSILVGWPVPGTQGGPPSAHGRRQGQVRGRHSGRGRRLRSGPGS